jgi:meso-butanediol dehydrogenase/(S,S)-butanediol dehydrogenase/diacetyl reductase
VARLEGKSIIVTGAGRGLGLSMMRRFVEEGAFVVAAARDLARLERVTAPFGDKAMAVQVDVGSPADVEALFEAVDKRFGKLDVLINNAAIYDFFQIDQVAPERIRTTVDSNLLGPMLCVRAAVPLMRKAGGGHIVNMTSEAVRNMYPFLTGYAATKTALENFSQGIRQELRPDNIKVSCMRLGAMDIREDGRALGVDPQLAPKLMERIGGAASFSGTTLMNLGTVADAAVNVLTLPADSTFDFVELRPTL